MAGTDRRPGVLMVCWHFPPAGGAGVQRSLQFAVNLARQGMRVVVLTPDGGHHFAEDASLLASVPAAVRVERVRGFDPEALGAVRQLRAQSANTPAAACGTTWPLLRYCKRFLSVPDTKLGWLPATVARGRALLQEEHLDTIYTTAPPYTAHLVGWLLHDLTGKRWLADFRDPWADNPYAAYATPLHRWLDRRLERAVVRAADAVIGVNAAVTAGLRRVAQDDGKCHTIYNGYVARSSAPPARAGGQFTVVHLGTLYGKRSAVPFLRAAGAFRRHCPAAGLRVVLVGQFDTEQAAATAAAVTEAGLADAVECTGFLPRAAALTRLQAADAALLVIHSDETPEKLFDYLQAEVPVLCLAPAGSEARALVERAGPAYGAEPEDTTAITAALTRLHADWQAGRLAPPDRAYVAQFDRQVQAQQLYRLLAGSGA